VRLSKNEYNALTLALDTAITVLELPSEMAPGVKRTEVNHSLIMLRALRSRLLRNASDPSADSSPTT
jgi:hypothetical protein